MASEGGKDAEFGGPGVRSLRSMWQERAKASENGTPGKGDAVTPKRETQRRGSDSQPPPSPSSRANTLLAEAAGSGAFAHFGISFNTDSFGALVIRKLTPGGPADLAGKLFPGDTLKELNGMDVVNWPLAKVEGLIYGDRKFSTLRLGVSRVGVQGLLNVELDGSGRTKPSPNMAPVAAKSIPAIPPLTQQSQSQASYPEGARPRSIPSQPAQRPSEYGQDVPLRPTTPIEEVPGLMLQVNSEEDEPTTSFSTRASLDLRASMQDTDTDNPTAKDDMRANVVRKYKARIEELSQGLEAAQVAAAQQRRQMEELHRGVSEKDELLREARETLSKMTLKLEETSRERAQARWALQEQHAQVQSLEQRLAQAGGASAIQSKEQKAWEDSLREEVVRLTREMDALRTERDVAALSAAPTADASDLVRELKLQLIEKDAKFQELESQAASLKRNNVIQAVELQELHDHVTGMERQKMVMQVQQFPALPALTSITESPYEVEMDEDDKMKAIMLADEALQKAQQEMASLKAADEKRVQLEFILANSQREVNRLREQLAERGGGGGGGGAGVGEGEREQAQQQAEELRRELAATQGKLQEARSSLYQAQTDVGEARRQAQAAEAAARGIEELQREVASLRQANAEQAAHRQQLQQQLASVQAQRPAAVAPPAPGPTGPDGPEAADGAGQAAHATALLDSLEGLDRQHALLQHHLARIATSPSPTRSSPEGGGDGGAERDKLRARDDILHWMKGQVEGAQEELSAALASLSRSSHPIDPSGGAREMREARVGLDKVLATLREVTSREVEGYGSSALVQQVGQLRAQLRGQDLALKQLTESQSETGAAAGAATQLVVAVQEVSALKAQLEAAARADRLLQAEIRGAKNAYAASRDQVIQLETEVRVLRAQAAHPASASASAPREQEGAGASPGAAAALPDDVLALQKKVREQERERERLALQLAEEKHSRSVLQEALSERAYQAAPANDYSAQLFDSLIAEKRAVEQDLDKLREEKRFVERCLSNARLDMARVEAASEQAHAELHEAQKTNAKLEGKLQAAQTRVTAAEKDVTSKKNDMAALNEQLKRLRQNMMQSGSEMGLENSSLRTELAHAQQEYAALKQRLDASEEKVKALESSGAAGFTGSPPRAPAEPKDLANLQHKLGVLAEQLQAQKQRAAQAVQQHHDSQLALANALAAEQEARQVAAVYQQEARAMREDAAAVELELQQKMDQVETLSAIIRRLQQQPSPSQSPKPAVSPPSSLGREGGHVGPEGLYGREAPAQPGSSGSYQGGASGASGREEGELDRVYRHDAGHEPRKPGSTIM